MMHTIASDSNGWHVGVWVAMANEAKFQSVGIFNTWEDACRFCNYLNGGTGTGDWGDEDDDQA